MEMGMKLLTIVTFEIPNKLSYFGHQVNKNPKSIETKMYKCHDIVIITKKNAFKSAGLKYIPF